MTVIEVLSAALIMLLFVSGALQALNPAIELYTSSRLTYTQASCAFFAAETFSNLCAEKGDIEQWKKDMRSIDGMESIEIQSIQSNDEKELLQAQCLIYGEAILIKGVVYK